MSRRELLDLEAQVSTATTEHDERRAAALDDRRELRRVGGRWIDADRMPDPADVEWGES